LRDLPPFSGGLKGASGCPVGKKEREIDVGNLSHLQIKKKRKDY